MNKQDFNIDFLKNQFNSSWLSNFVINIYYIVEQMNT